jgi:hypothetical protein
LHDRNLRSTENVFPDPSLTANLYCAGRLNEVIFHVVRPAWRRFQDGDPEELWYLWFMRYGKGGEHLKIRAHGPAEGRALLTGLLIQSAEAYFSSLEPVDEVLQRDPWEGAPPIDAQDNVSTRHPDRSLLWTDYLRSHISLGGKPLLLDDRYAALATECLARAAEIAFQAIEPDEHGNFPHQRRQSTLLGGLISSMAALGFTCQQRSAYLQYHRDSLLRFLVRKNKDPFAKVRETLGRFHLQASKMGDSFHRLESLAREQWEQGPRDAQSDRPEARWCRSLVRLQRHISPLCQDPDFHLDPFSLDPTFPPLFKTIHGFANHLGIALADEAFAHHILLVANDPEAEGARRVRLLPE